MLSGFKLRRAFSNARERSPVAWTEWEGGMAALAGGFRSLAAWIFKRGLYRSEGREGGA